MRVPTQFVGRKYSKLFDALTTRRQIIPLGLYRSVFVDLNAYKDSQNYTKFNKTKTQKAQDSSLLNNKGENRDIGGDESHIKEIKYVVTNPEKDTRLEKSDLVFVLARNDPGDPE